MTTTLAVVYDASDFLLSSFRDRDGNAAAIRETEARIERIAAGLRASSHVRWSSAVASHDETVDIVARMHEPTYLEFLATTGEQASGDTLATRFAAPGVLPDTPVTAGAYDAAVHAATSAVAAAARLVRGDRHAYALCRPPGHHAGRAFMGGYCYLNNACAAAWSLRDAGRTVAVVDVDFHHGNGTADMLATEYDVPFISLHASTRLAFPYIDTAPTVPHQWFVPFDEPPTEAEYLHQLADHLRHVASADILVVSLGYDLVEGDPHGGWRMTPDFFRQLGRTLAATGRQLCIVQEGGYALDQLAACSHAFAEGLT